MTDKHARILAVTAAILIAAAMRLVPHPPNFTPIGAMALFGGAYLGRHALAFAAPLAALALSDLALGGAYPGMAYVYVSVALIVLFGWTLQQHRSVLRVGGAALASSVLFYVVTNFGTWATSGMYPRTVEGLTACYVAAIPFFQNTVAGDLLFSGLLFGGFAMLERIMPRLREPALQPA